MNRVNIKRADPPVDAEWDWVIRRLGVARNRITGHLIWSWSRGRFVCCADHRGAWSLGLHIFGRFLGHHKRAGVSS